MTFDGTSRGPRVRGELRSLFLLLMLSCLGPAAGCSSRWDASGWAAGRPELRGMALGALGDATPYPLPRHEELLWFLCRWSLEAPVPVFFTDTVDSADMALLGRALGAWEAAVPGLRFAEVGRGTPLLRGIRVGFAPGGGQGARAVTDCWVAPGGGPDRLRAEVWSAAILLRRTETGAFGRRRALTEAELLGAAVHELGHALGLQGHARGGSDTVLVREVDRVRRVGRRLLAGGTLHEPAMRALYAVPSGTIVARQPIGSGWGGWPTAARWRVRVGDSAADWVAASRPELRHRLRDPARVLSGEMTFHESYERSGPPDLSPRSGRSRVPSAPGSKRPRPRPGPSAPGRGA